MTNRVLHIASTKCEQVLERGIKFVLEDITKSKELVEQLSQKNDVPNKDIGKPIAELDNKSEVLGEIWDRMKVNRGMF